MALLRSVSRHLLVVVVIAIGGALVSVTLFTILLGELAAARFWEPLVVSGHAVTIEALSALLALASGFAVGAFVGAALGFRAPLTTMLGGVIAAGIWLCGAAVYGETGIARHSLLAAGMLGLGLRLGGVCVARIRHA